MAEHRLARLVQLGMRQSRYIDRAKTFFQLSMTATVANLTLVAGKMGRLSKNPNYPQSRSEQPAPSSLINTGRSMLSAANTIALRLTTVQSLSLQLNRS